MTTTTHDHHQVTTLGTTKRGEFIRRKPGAPTVWIRGEYCRASKRYSLVDFNDCNREIFLKKSTPVYIGFTF
jgi:hypothetical protein